MRELIKRILREEANWKWDSFDDAIPLPDGELKKYILHSTTIDPLLIYNNGIEPHCASKSSQWTNYRYPCSVFAMNGYHEIWSQKDTEGVVVIDTTLLKNKWWYDPSLYNKKAHDYTKIAIVTDEKIPADAIIGVLCVRDLFDMKNEFRRTKSDESTQKYLDAVMKENSEKWSYDCDAKFEYELEYEREKRNQEF